MHRSCNRCPFALAALVLGAGLALAGPDEPASDETLRGETLRSETPQDGAAQPPEWFVEHVAFMTKDGGRWIADNAPHRTDQEPYDAYGIEWRPGLGGHGMTGRLFGLRAGQEVATFWEFRTYWHPGDRKVYAMQFGGNGVVGIGTVEAVGPRTTRMAQEFFAPNGRQFSVGHESTDTASGEHVTRSFDIQPDGSWKDRRAYTWRRDAS